MTASTDNRHRYPKRILMMLGIFVLLVIFTLSLFVRSGMAITERNVLLMHLMTSIKHSTSTFHLAVEELAQGDNSMGKGEIIEYLNMAERLSHILLQGGEYEGVVVTSIDDAVLKEAVEKTRLSLVDLKVVAIKRIALSPGWTGDSGESSEYLDRHLDAIYETVISYSDQAENTARAKIAHELSDYRYLSFFVGILFVFSSLLIAYLLIHYEQLRRNDMLQIEASGERLRTIINTVAEALITFDESGEIESLNPAAQTMFGYQNDELVGHNINTLLPSTDPNHPDCFLDQFTDEGNSQSIGRTTEFEAVKKDGIHFPIQITVNEMSLGGIRYFTASGRDITVQKNHDQALDEYSKQIESEIIDRTQALTEAMKDAEQANHAKSDFLIRMSHELRMPLNSILGFSQILKLDSTRFDETQKSNVHDILAAGQHMLVLVDEVLDLAKIEAGELEVTMESVAVDDIVQQCISLIAPQAQAHQLTLVDNISDRGYQVHADAMRFKQVLLSYLTNALKYNGDQGTITLSSQLINHNRLRIMVSDTGQGLTEAEVNKLFLSFERLDAKSNIGGIGIGLVIAKRLAGLMNASIGVDSEVGVGSRFWVELDIVREERG